MIIELVHWLALASACAASFIYFRDIGDVTQIVLDVPRQKIVSTIRNEKTIVGLAFSGLGIALGTHYWLEAGYAPVLYSLAAIASVMVVFPLVWIYVGLRNQQTTATYYPIEEARNYLRPEDSVLVIENNGVARAHPDYHMKRPHLTGTPDGLDGENVIMTYCALTHLGMAYKPEINNEKLDLQVIAQHGNNLIMKDRSTGEPIQQVYGTRERDGIDGVGMQPWPTFRMSFKAFAKVYPQGKVFLNKPVSFLKNPPLYLLDKMVEATFLVSLVPHHAEEALIMDNVPHKDDRLRKKTLVWGVTVNGASAAYTEEFVRNHDNLINVTVGGQAMVFAYFPEFDSLGAYYNDTDRDITQIDFGGQTDNVTLKRVNNLQAGGYWFVWANYFPNTTINDLGTTLSEASHESTENPPLAAAT